MYLYKDTGPNTADLVAEVFVVMDGMITMFGCERHMGLGPALLTANLHTSYNKFGDTEGVKKEQS